MVFSAAENTIFTMGKHFDKPHADTMCVLILN